jgi:nucleoid-associated protein YgaU
MPPFSGNRRTRAVADIQAPAGAAEIAGGAPVTPQRTYTVQPGDSLSKISQHFYGNANQYMKIFEANRDKLPDPDKVRAGMELNMSFRNPFGF